MEGWHDVPDSWLWRWSKEHEPYPHDQEKITSQYDLRRYHKSFQFCCQEHLEMYQEEEGQEFLEL